jgi:Protein of unknown function DUF262
MKMRSQKRELDKVYKRRDRYETPDWQREKVWGKAKKQKLIDSILRGWTLPKFYLLKSSDNNSDFEVVDGQQRLTAIFEFMGNSLELSAKAREEFGGPLYKDLTDSASDAFDDFEIEYDEIEDASDKDIKDFFQRLQEGLPLTGSEKLNSVDSNLRDYCKNLSLSVFFTDKVLLSDKRYAYFDIVSKAAAIEIEGIDVGLRFENLKDVFAAQEKFSSASQVATRLESALKFLVLGLPNNAPITRNRSVTQSIITLVCALRRNNVDDNKAPSFGKFCVHFGIELAKQIELGQKATDADYLSFQRTINANTRYGAKIRHDILLRKILQFDATFADNTVEADLIASGLPQSIKNDGTTITSLVSSINEGYSAQNGMDLFKATNKTTKALLNIGNMKDSYEKYKELIENLYFLFWEGQGQRLKDENILISFADINKLRTNLQHDTDHGKAAAVKKKNKDLGLTFEKYAGVPSPEVAAPERFPIVHSNILNAIKSDLSTLAAKYS